MRNTRQREEILSFLRTNRGHFTAPQVYEAVRVKFPDISLGTVYRNLGNLASLGEIVVIESSSKCSYYDGTREKHMHFICNKCGEVYDFPIEENAFACIKRAGFEISPTSSLCYGTCKKCLK